MDPSTNTAIAAVTATAAGPRAHDAIVKLQAFCRGCLTRQKVSNMIGQIIDELEREVQNETEEFAPLAGETGNTSDAYGAAALDMSERSIGTASSSASSFDEQQLNHYLHHFIQEEQQEHQDDKDNHNVLENSLEFDLDNDQDPFTGGQPHSSPIAGGSTDYTGAIDSKIERYLQSPKKSARRSVTTGKDIKVKRGSVQAATTIFSAPLHDNTFTITPKKPKTPWKPNVAKRSPRLSSSSIMDKVNIFSQSLPLISMTDDDLAEATAATSPRKKRAVKVNPDTAQTARKALAGRHRLLRQAAITIQARARGYLVRKFDLKAMNKVMDYVKEYQTLVANQSDDNDELPIPLDPESEPSGDAQDQMELEEEPIPEPKVEELEKAWSVLQINRASQTSSQDPTAPSDELPQPIKVKELLSTWEWLKAKQRDSFLRQEPPPSSIPPTTPTPTPPTSSSRVHHQTTPMQETIKCQSPSLDRPSEIDRPMGHDNVQASSLDVSANESMPLGSSDSTLPLLPDEVKDKDKGHDRPISSTEHPFLARISDTVPPRTGDLVAFYSWLEQNRLYQTVSDSFRYSAAPSRRDAAAEIKQAKLNAIIHSDDDHDDELNLPSQSPLTEPPLSNNSTDELESSRSIKETTNAIPTLDANMDVDNQSSSPSLESAASVQHQQQEPHNAVEQQHEIHQSWKTEPAPTMSTLQPALLSSQAANNSINLQEEDPTAELRFKTGANKSPLASPTSIVYTEQNQMEATIAAISKQLESLASSTSPSLDNKRETQEQMMLRKIRENIRTGKVNFDEVFELWTWLEMNDFDMTKFKKRAVELGIVDSSTLAGPTLKPLTERTTTTTISKLDPLPPSQVGSVQSRIQANIQQIEQKVQQHGFVRPQNSTTLPVPIRSYSTQSHEDYKDQSNQHPKERGKIVSPTFLNETNRDSGPSGNAKLNDSTNAKAYTVEYINEDLSAIYRPQTNKARKLAQNWWSNVYVQGDAKPSHQDDKTNMDHGRRGEESRSSPITYLDEDLSNIYRNQRDTPQSVDRDLGAKIDEAQISGSQIMYLDEDLSNVYRKQSGPRRDTPTTNSKNLDRDVGANIDEKQTSGSQIMYLDEDLSNVYRNQSGSRRDTPTTNSKNLDRDLGAKIDEKQTSGSQIMYLDEDLSNVYRNQRGSRRDTPTTNSKNLVRDVGANIDEKQATGSQIMYLDEDLSNVYRSPSGQKRDTSTTNSKGMDSVVGVQRAVATSTAMNPMLSGNHSPHRSLHDFGEKIILEESGGSQIIYLDEDFSNVYRQGITETSRGNKTSEHKPYSHRPELQTKDASQSTMEYIDEDLSGVYTSKTNQGVFPKPSLKAMVTYWEFSKLNDPGDNEMQDENDEPLESLVDHQARKDTHPSWQTNPYSNKMLNTLKWLEKQGVDLDKVKATDDSLAESTEDLALSASQLESNAATAADLKEQDLTKTMDWLAKHGHVRRKSTTPTGSPTSGLKTLSSNTDTSVLLIESTANVFDESSPVAEMTRPQTKSDLTVALRWLKRHSYQGSGRRSSIESNDSSRLETQLSPPEDPRPGNQNPESMGTGSDDTEKKSREPLYDKNVLYSLSWLQKHGFDLDKSIHAERKRDYIPLEKQNIDTSQGPEGDQAPTIESMMEALATIDDDEYTKGMTPQQKRNSIGRPTTPSKASRQDIENALTWLEARGIGKPNKKPSKKGSDASPNEFKATAKKASREIQSDISATTEKSHTTEGDKKADKINLSSNEMSSALKWLNRKGIATTTTKPLKGSAPKSPEKSPKSKRKPKGLNDTDTKKILDIMKTKGTFSQTQRLSQEDVEQALRFLKLQESKNAVSPQKIENSRKKVPNEFEAKQLASMSTKTMDKDLVSASKKEARAKEPSKKVPLSPVRKIPPSPVRKVPRAGRNENSTLPKQSDPPSSPLNIDSSSKTKSDSTDKARDKPRVEKKSNSRSSKTRSESPGPRKNTSKTRNAKEMRSKSGDFIGDISSSPKKSKSSASTADMQKSLKWLQTKASMASPLRTPTTAQAQLSTKDWKNKIPSLAPLDADDQASSRSRLPPLPGKKKAETAKMDEKAVQDYHNALKFLNSDDVKGIEDASYFKKLDNTLPKRPGESKEARAKEIAKALAWVKKQGLFDATSKSSKKGKAPPRRSSSVNDAISIFEQKSPIVEQKPPTDRPEEERNIQKESKVQTERKKLSSIKDMTKQATQRQKEMDGRIVEAGNRRLSASEPTDLAGQDFENALKFVLTKQSGGDVTGITDAMNFKKLDNMLPQKDGQSSKDRAREMVKLLDWLRKKGIA